jgi:hypothetical protein
MTRRLTFGLLIASALVALVSLAILIFAYPPHTLDHAFETNCREVKNTAGQIVARVCGERGETTMPPVSGTGIDHSPPSSGFRIP